MSEMSKQLAQGVAGVFRVLALWNVDDGEIRRILGFPIGAKIAGWQAGDLSTMSHDVVQRLRHVGAIHKPPRNHAAGAAAWLRQSLPQFANQTPVMRMASGDAADLVAVRDHLKSRERFQIRLETLRRGQ